MNQHVARRMGALLILVALTIALSIKAAATEPMGFWVVAASFDRYEPAWTLARTLRTAGRESRVIPAYVGGKLYFRASAGPYDTKLAADSVRDGLRASGYEAAWVISYSLGAPRDYRASRGDREFGGRVLRVSILGGDGSVRELCLGSDRPFTISGLRVIESDTALATLTIDSPTVSIGLTSSGLIAVTAEGGEPLIFEPPVQISLRPDQSSPFDGFTWSGSPGAIYSGDLSIGLDALGGIRAINLIPLEDYLLGVLSYEIGANAPIEALRAQAVASRTEALFGRSRHQSDGFDLCSTTHCQVYQGAWPGISLANIIEAIESTRGEVLTYQGLPVEHGKFHASCGGWTESAGELWGAAIPYLEPVRCIEGSRTGIPNLSRDRDLQAYIDKPDPKVYCHGTNGHRWTASVRIEEFKARICADPKSAIMSIELADRTSRGAARTAVISTTAGVITIRGELAIRNAFGGPTVAKSSAFIMTGDIRSGRIGLKGAGYGHGVGLCQYGARNMAALGIRYRAILEHYYRGTVVTRAY